MTFQLTSRTRRLTLSQNFQEFVSKTQCIMYDQNFYETLRVSHIYMAFQFTLENLTLDCIKI